MALFNNDSPNWRRFILFLRAFIGVDVILWVVWSFAPESRLGRLFEIQLDILDFFRYLIALIQYKQAEARQMFLNFVGATPADWLKDIIGIVIILLLAFAIYGLYLAIYYFGKRVYYSIYRLRGRWADEREAKKTEQNDKTTKS